MSEQSGIVTKEKKEPLEEKGRMISEINIGDSGGREVEIFSRERQKERLEEEKLEKELQAAAKVKEFGEKKRLGDLPQPPVKGKGRPRDSEVVMTPATSTWKYVLAVAVIILMIVLGRKVFNWFVGRGGAAEVAEGKVELCTFEDLNGNGSWDKDERALAWDYQYRINQGEWQDYRTRAGRFFFWRRKGCGGKIKVAVGDRVEIRSASLDGWKQTTAVEVNEFQVKEILVEVKEIGFTKVTGAEAVAEAEKEETGEVTTAAVLGTAAVESGKTEYRVCKFDDVNGNGEWDNEEPGLVQSFKIKEGSRTTILPYRTVTWGKGGCGSWREVAMGTEVEVAQGGVLGGEKPFKFKVNAPTSFRVVFSNTQVALARDYQLGQTADLNSPVWGGQVSLAGVMTNGTSGEAVTVAAGADGAVNEATMAAKVATGSATPAVSPKTGPNDWWLIGLVGTGLVGFGLLVKEKYI